MASKLVENLHLLLTSFIEGGVEKKNPKELADLLTILKAHAKAVKQFNVASYKSFPAIFHILDYFSRVDNKHYQNSQEEEKSNSISSIPPDSSSFVRYCAKILSRAIRIPDSQNIHLFISHGGFDVVIGALSCILRRIVHEAKNEDNTSGVHYELSPTYNDVKSLNLFVRCLSVICLEKSEEFEALKAGAKVDLLISLQQTARIPLTLFSSFRTQYREEIAKKPNTGSGKKESTKEKADEIATEGITLGEIAAMNVFDLLARPAAEVTERIVCERRIIRFFENLLVFFTALSCNLHLASLAIQTGIAWRCLEIVGQYGSYPPCGDKALDSNMKHLNEKAIMAALVLRNLLIHAEVAQNPRESPEAETSPSKMLEIETTFHHKRKHEAHKTQQPKAIKKTGSDKENDIQVVTSFHSACLALLGLKLIRHLLKNHGEPRAIPTQVDRVAAEEFLYRFGSSLYEPLLIWNEEVREELQQFLSKQIDAITLRNAER